MDNLPSEFETSQAYTSDQPIPELRDDWNPYVDDYDYVSNTSQSLAFPNFYNYPDDPYQLNTIAGQGQMAQLRDQTHPSSHGRAIASAGIRMPSRPANPIQQRKGKAAQSQNSKKDSKVAKRQKVANPGGRGHQRCYSEVSQVSECCSSCPDTPPCDVSDCCSEAECDLQPISVVPCYEQSCEKPVCSNPCLSTGIQVSMPALPLETRTSNWLESQWLPQSSTAGMMSQGVGGPYDSHYTSTSASPAPTTPSMSQHIATPYSPNTTLPTPQYATFPSMGYHDNGPLSSTTTTFPTTNWANIAPGASNSLMTSCLWNGCQEQQFDNEQQWISHLHNSHIDPQMNFGCPLQGDTCPPSMNMNPFDHLQTDHGFNFDFGSNGFNCPAPDCGPNQTFFSPSMFHNHFDQIHAVPAHGSLQCGWGTCNTPFVDPQDLIAHLSQQHNLPVSLPIDHAHHHQTSVSTETASILASLPKIGSSKKRSASPTPATTTTPELETGADFSIKDNVHQCKWNDGDAPCGEICESEEALQKHIKHAHLESLDKSTGYKCRWDGCSRDSRRGEAAGFTQRGKLERHMATHTGCKLCGSVFVRGYVNIKI